MDQSQYKKQEKKCMISLLPVCLCILHILLIPLVSPETNFYRFVVQVSAHPIQEDCREITTPIRKSPPVS